MSEIDNRIVQMRFDNKQFESGVQQTTTSLDRLKKGLQLEESAKSLSNLERVGKNFSLAGIASGVETLTNKFSALSLIGITALQNITNSAINAGKRMVSALTIDPIKMGFNEYETKMGAIQTILTNTASKGTTLDDVTKALNELNEYSDKTIYNFAEMAKNIGTFTAAGIDLKTSTQSIKGIANLAAGSGSTSQQASTAMYQLSQALAAGTVKLMDWNSVVNAGMGGELFQNALKKTAKGMGIVMDESIPFRQSLEKGWLTAEVLTKTLSDFAEDEALVKAATQVKTFTQLFDTMKESVQSGWAQTWEAIIGDKNEATALFTQINNIFGSLVGKAADSRNAMLAFWKANDGRDMLIEGLFNAFKGLQEIIKPVSDAFREIFPPITAQQLVNLSRIIRDISLKFTVSEKTAENLKNTFKGFFAIIDIGRMAISALASKLGGLLQAILPIGGGILETTGSFGEWLVSVRDMIKSTDFFNNAFSKLGDVFGPVAEAISKAFGAIIGAFKGFATADLTGLNTFSERVQARLEPFKKLGEVVSKAFAKIGEAVKSISPIFYRLAEIAGEGLGRLQENIAAGLQAFNFDTLFDIFNGGIMAGIGLGIKKFIDTLGGAAADGKGFLGQIKGILDGVRGCLTAYQDSLKANTLMKIAGAIAVLAASLVVLSLIDSKTLTVSLAAITTLFIELFGAMALFGKIMGKDGFTAMGKATGAMIGLSAAVLILSVAMKTLAGLEWEDIGKGLLAITVLSGVMVAAAKIMSQNTGKLTASAIGLVIFAKSIQMLVEVVQALGAMNLGDLTKGLIGVGVLVASLAIFTKVASFDKLGMGQGLGLLALAAGLNIMATAVIRFAAMDPGKLVMGLGALAAVMLELALFTQLTGGAQKVTATAIGLTILGGALLIFSAVVNKLGSMEPKTLIQGLIGIAGALVIMGAAAMLMQKALPGAAAILVMSVALMALAPALAILGSMSLAEVGTGLLALAGVFVVLGLAGLVLAPLTPVILALSGAVALLGVGILALGAGVMLFSAGLAALSAGGTAAAGAIVVIVASLLGLIPLALTKLGEGVVALAKVLGDAAPTLIEAAVKLISVLIEAIIRTIPLMIDGVTIFVEKTLQALLRLIPKVVSAGIELILAFLKGISDNIQKVVEVAIQIVINFINGIIKMVPAIIQVGYDLMLAFINGLADSIRKNTTPVINAVKNLISAIVESMLGVGKEFISVGKNLVDGFIVGIKSKIEDAAQWTANLATSVLDSAKQALGIHSPAKETEVGLGLPYVQGFGKGISKNADIPADAAAAMARDSVNAARDAGSDGMQTYGATIIADMKGQIEKAAPGAVKAVEEVGKKTGKAAGKSAAEGFKAMTAWIDEEKYYNRLTLQQELDIWEKAQKRYKLGSEERNKIDREVYRLKNELIADSAKKEKEAFDHSVSWIEEKKYYNQLGLNEELAAWQRVQARYKAGSEERKKADREVYRLQKELSDKRKALEDDYAAKVTSVNEQLKADIKDLNDAYDSALQARTDAIFKAYGLFEKLGDPTVVTGQELTDNLEGQVNALKEWRTNIQTLVNRGLKESIIDELRELGPRSLDQVKALNAMTDPELERYANLWQDKFNIAGSVARNELSDLKADTANAVAGLKIQAHLDLKDLGDEYRTGLAAIGVTATEEMAIATKAVTDAATTMTTETTATLKTFTGEVEKVFITTDWKSIGENMILGIIKGLNAKLPELATTAANAAQQALIAAKKTLGIKSPSKEFEKVGMYANMGFVNGLNGSTNNIISSATDMGNAAINTLRAAISNLASLVSGEMDTAPVIRPVLDLTDIASGNKTLGEMLSATKGIDVTASNLKVDRIATSMASKTSSGSVSSTETTNNTKSEIHMVNNFSVRNDDDIRKISNKLGNLFDRYANAKGVTVP